MSEPAWEQEHDGLVDTARRATDPDEKVRLLEAAVQMADLHHDPERGYQARKELIDAATFGGYPHKALLAFAWCRARAQADPARYGGRYLLWRHKWVVDALPRQLGVTRAQILAAQDDYATAIEQHGGSARSAAKLRFTNALDMGDLDEAARWYAAWKDTPTDPHSDCRACDVQAEVNALVIWERYDEALRQAAPLLARQLSCAEVPHGTYDRLALANFWLGHLDEARRVFWLGYRLVRKNRTFLANLGRYLAFLGLTHNLAAALTLIEQRIAWVLESRAALDTLHFHLAARFVLQQIAAAGETDIALRLPRRFPLHRRDGLYDVRALTDWFDGRATDLAARFDERNGNAYYTTQLARSQHWVSAVKPFPVKLGAPARR